MTAKRFKLAYADYDWWAICDKENPTELGISGQDVVELLNELHEENQLIKDTLNELKSIDGFWDSALLQGYISKIAKILGVDLE